MDKNAKEGYGKVLGRLEQEILEVLWEGGPLSGKDIFSDIRRRRDLALTTVLTVLERLAKKGLVRKKRGESVYLFEAAYTREGFARAVSGEVLKSIFDISRSGACASFVDMLASSDPAELEELSSMIEKKKREMERVGE